MNVPGSNIALLRRQMGLSQKSLAAAAKIDIGNLSKLESGKMGYSKETIGRIAQVLCVSVGVLFAEPGVVEAAALRMRAVPLLTADQLMRWRRPDELDLGDEQVYLHADLRAVSNHAFALEIADDANVPILAIGDQVIFDAKKQPSAASLVAAQDSEGNLFIGRFRQVAARQGSPLFEVVPIDHFYPIASSEKIPGLHLRGTMAERRTSFR